MKGIWDGRMTIALMVFVVVCVAVSAQTFPEIGIKADRFKAFQIREGNGSGMIVSFSPTGKVTLGEGYTPDSASADFLRALQRVADRTVTISFTEAEWAAAKKRVGICEAVPVDPKPGADVSVMQFDCIPTITSWAHKQLRDNLTPELTALRVEKAEAVEADDDGLKALDAKDCALINTALKARKKPELKRCGGGRVP